MYRLSHDTSEHINLRIVHVLVVRQGMLPYSYKMRIKQSKVNTSTRKKYLLLILQGT